MSRQRAIQESRPEVAIHLGLFTEEDTTQTVLFYAKPLGLALIQEDQDGGEDQRENHQKAH